jgi:hypothetical protein
MVTNVPAIGGIQIELVKLFEIYGAIVDTKILDEYPESDQFLDVYLIQFEKVQNSRIAKIKMDDYNFFGSVLHVFYAPEHETIDNFREKLNERRFIIKSKCERYDKMGFGTLRYDIEQSKMSQIKVNPKPKSLRLPSRHEPPSNDRVYGPMPESNAHKSAITGDDSYDKSVKEIRSKMKETIVRVVIVIRLIPKT